MTESQEKFGVALIYWLWFLLFPSTPKLNVEKFSLNLSSDLIALLKLRTSPDRDIIQQWKEFEGLTSCIAAKGKENNDNSKLYSSSPIGDIFCRWSYRV